MEFDERLFEIKELLSGKTFLVDLFSDGAFPPPEGVDATVESWRAWLKDTFVDKIIEIERITPYTYFSGGKQKIIKQNHEN